MANVEQKCGQCVYFRLGRSTDNPRYSRVAGMLELFKSGDPRQLPQNTGTCKAPYETFDGKKQAPDFTTFSSQNCGARDSDQKILFQPKK